MGINVINKKESGMSRKGMELGHGSHGVVYEVIDFEDM